MSQFSNEAFQTSSLVSSNRNNCKLVSCSSDNTIKIWDLKTNNLINTLNEHMAEVSCLELIGNTRFASGSFDGTIIIWDAEEYVQRLTDNQLGIWCLKALSQNKIASGSNIKIKIWDLSNGLCTGTLNGHHSYVRHLDRLQNGTLTSVCMQRVVKIWDLDQCTCLKTLNSLPFNDIVFIFLDSGHLVSGSIDSIIKIWNADSRECVNTLTGHTGGITQLKTLANGELISSSGDQTIKYGISRTEQTSPYLDMLKQLATSK